jgi:type VI secretion system secreted protein VgrG
MDTRALTTVFEAGPLASLDVMELRIERRLGQVAEADVEVRASTYAEPDDLLGVPARIAFGRGQADHQMLGIVTTVGMVTSPEDDDRDHLLYRIRVSSCLALLERQVDCRIFQEKSVKDIVSGVLRDFGITDAMQSWRLSATYPTREYCVQYRESALAFVKRLLEEEGIFFYSDVGDEGELLVFEDDSGLVDPVDGTTQVRYRHGAGLDATDDAVGVITERHRTATGTITLRDYDYKRPQLDLTCTAAAAADPDLEVYDYPGLYVDPAVGERLAQVKLEALQAERVTLELESDCPRIVPGRWLELVEAPGDLDGAYVVTARSTRCARASTACTRRRSPRR